MRKATIPFCLILILIVAVSCSKKSSQKGEMELTITSHKTGEKAVNPMPLAMKGKVEGYNSLSAEKKKNLHLYLVEQSTQERIWHIEPEAKLDEKGNWTAVTWLGKRHEKDDNKFHVCLVALDKRLKLKNGNHPVKEKPKGMAETCIDLEREMK